MAPLWPPGPGIGERVATEGRPCSCLILPDAGGRKALRSVELAAVVNLVPPRALIVPATSSVRKASDPLVLFTPPSRVLCFLKIEMHRRRR